MVFIGGSKLTTDVMEEVCYCPSECKARAFCTAPVGRLGTGLGMFNKHFDLVDWKVVSVYLAPKSKMYGLWL